MARIARVVAVDAEGDGGIEVIRVDFGGGDVKTARYFQPSGDDSKPLPGDFVLLERSDGAGAWAVTGFADPDHDAKSSEGEKRLYSRDEDGNLMAEAWLRSDGTIILRVLKAGSPVVVETNGGAVTVKSPDIRLGEGASRGVARLGDLFAGATPPLISGAPGSPVMPIPPTSVTPTGGILVSGQIISASQVAKAK